MLTENVMVGTTVVPLLPSSWGALPGLTEVHVYVQGAAIRLRTDGGNPTATNGILLAAGSVSRLTTVAARTALVISATAIPAAVTISNAALVTLEAAYTSESFVITGTGFSTVVTGTALYVKNGADVNLFIPTLTGTSNAATFTLTGLPAAIVPTQTSFHMVMLQDNGTRVRGLLRFNAASSTIVLYVDLLTAIPTDWTASGTKVIFAIWVPYALL